MNESDGRNENLQLFSDFVAKSRWRFAKTYAESYPHEYTLQRWGDADSFWTAILCIERWGVSEPFWNVERRTSTSTPGRTWHMGHPSSEKPDERPGLINRTWLDVASYREDVRSLGYDGQSLDELVTRWKLLLEKARRGA